MTKSQTDRQDREDQPTPLPSPLLDHLRLLRAPNVFTAIADVTAGYAIAVGTPRPDLRFLFLVLASSSLYLSGMVLNDVFDVETDRRERPQRPLPSGRIALGWARRLGFGLLLVGIVCGWVAGYVGLGEGGLPWRSGMVATALAGCILLYDGLAKRTTWGAFVMGSCRGLNILLGMSVGATTGGGLLWAAAYEPWQLIIAGGLALYIAGVTWYARSEAQTSQAGSLAVGIGWMIGGFALLAAFPRFGAEVKLRIDGVRIWPLLVVMLAAPILRRCGTALFDPTPARVQAAVKSCILSLIILDAALTACFANTPGYWSLGIVALLVPTLVLGRWVYST